MRRPFTSRNFFAAKGSTLISSVMERLLCGIWARRTLADRGHGLAGDPHLDKNPCWADCTSIDEKRKPGLRMSLLAADLRPGARPDRSGEGTRSLPSRSPSGACVPELDAFSGGQDVGVPV